MLLVLAHTGDTEAALLARELGRRVGDAGVALVWAEELLLGSNFTHSVNVQGAMTEVELTSGQRLASDELAGVACRLTHAPVPHFDRTAEPDRHHATIEAHALLISWLAGLRCPVINPVTSQGLSGPKLEPPELLSLATACGLRSRHPRLDSRSDPQPRQESLTDEPRTVLVAGEMVFDALTTEESLVCAELARRLGCPVLGVQFATSVESDEQLFCGVDPLPRLGPEGAVAVADLMVGVPV
jgi:hypothetical protein